MLTIWYGGIESKSSDITKFCNLLHIYLANAHATTLPKNSRHNVLQNQPLAQKLYCASLSKTLDPTILQQMFFWEIES